MKKKWKLVKCIIFYLFFTYIIVNDKITNFNSDPVSSDSEDELEAMRGKYDLLVDADTLNSKKSSKKEFPPMFPYYEEKSKFDPYGEIIKYGCFLFLKIVIYNNLISF